MATRSGSSSKKARSRVLGLDLGEARVGLAVSDDLRMYAHPRGTLPLKPWPAFVLAITELIAQENVRRIVVGFPLDMKGGEGDRARRTRDLAQRLADATQVQVELWDERLSTVQATRALHASEVHGRKIKAHVDEASAVMILQAYLERGK